MPSQECAPGASRAGGSSLKPDVVPCTEKGPGPHAEKAFLLGAEMGLPSPALRRALFPVHHKGAAMMTSVPLTHFHKLSHP